MRTAGGSWRWRGSLTLALGLLASGCVSTQDIESIQSQLADVQRQLLQLQAQSPSKNEVDSLTAQVAKQNDALLKSEADIQLRLQQVSSELEQLQARLEDTNNRLASLSQQIAATNQELKGFRSLPRFNPLAPGDPGAPPSAGQQPGADPQALYEAAYSDYVRGSYDLAIRQFQEYLTNFPDTDLSDNAAYWTGEAYYRQSKFRQAISEFDRVLERYPGSDKVASALLKKGYAYLELGDRNQGVSQLQKVLRDFPRSDEARLASQRLKEVGR